MKKDKKRAKDKRKEQVEPRARPESFPLDDSVLEGTSGGAYNEGQNTRKDLSNCYCDG